MPSRAKQEVTINGRPVDLTNLTKALYPLGFTKGQVIDYYIRVSDWLLPHIQGHPVTLRRCPNGVQGKCFYEKDAPSFTPEWVHTFDVPRREGGHIHYVLLDDLPSLVWAANAANLELHPFLHRVPHIDQPTALVFDLDPGEGADLLSCAKIAFLLKEALAAAGLECWPKVSGSKGMQLYAPLNTSASYAETQPFARRLAEILESAHSDLVISSMAKVKRAGKVFIDWSQNSDFKTTVAVYSLRAKNSEPYVSMPVEWDELRRATRRKSISALRWTPDAALKRLERLGDLFAPVQERRQKLPELTRSAA
ncbi:MAG TPA: non-homologous end-joining DNA ligase [Bryobacteraceae bacterium]|jgi:bifunctional non-homologous end joining protein LigD|nr:non-homologous end-joining DNA ligase [Bryobacteraceae bacterium]